MIRVDDIADAVKSLTLLSGDMQSPGGRVSSSNSVRCWHRSVRYVMLSSWRSNNSSTVEWFLHSSAQTGYVVNCKNSVNKSKQGK